MGSVQTDSFAHIGFIGIALGMLALAVLLGSPVFAGDHVFDDSGSHFVAAWNAHDRVDMASRLTENATAVDASGRTTVGRAALTDLFTAGTSTLRLTSPVVVRSVGREPGVDERDIGYEGVVSFTAEISGEQASVGSRVSPAER